MVDCSYRVEVQESGVVGEVREYLEGFRGLEVGVEESAAGEGVFWVDVSGGGEDVVLFEEGFAEWPSVRVDEV